MSRPESLAAMRQPSSLWDSMDMQVMFEIRAPDDSTIYFIYAPTQWKLEASHVLQCKNRGSMTFIEWVMRWQKYRFVPARMAELGPLTLQQTSMSSWGFRNRPPLPPQKKNQQKQVTKVCKMQTSTCRDGTLKNQPNKIGTTQYFYTIPTSCAILPTMYNTKPHA